MSLEESSRRHEALKATQMGSYQKQSVLSYQTGRTTDLQKQVFTPKFGDFIAINIFYGIMVNSYAFHSNP